MTLRLLLRQWFAGITAYSREIIPPLSRYEFFFFEIILSISNKIHIYFKS